MRASRILLQSLAWLLAVANVGVPTQGAVKELMPALEDHTSMWWRDGFPGHVPGAEWVRCIRTGLYAMALNTETLEIPHLGAVRAGSGYLDGSKTEVDWGRLPSARLELEITADGKAYRCVKGGKWSRFTGPRLIVSGRFLQRADITNLEFAADDGERLVVEARLETAAWPDRLGWSLSARPGIEAIPAGEQAFGRVGGGFGFDGSNHLAVPHRNEFDSSKFTLEMWAFVPADYQANARTSPWLVCKNRHEQNDGNYGIVIQQGEPEARLNIGGGRENQFVAKTGSKTSLKLDEWNHLAMSYDGEFLRLFVNGRTEAMTRVGRERVAGREPLVFGRRLAAGNNYCFRGVLDEIRFYDRPLTENDLRSRQRADQMTESNLNPVGGWSFREDGHSSMKQLRARWSAASMSVRLKSLEATMEQNRVWTSRPPPDEGNWQTVSLWLDPVALEPVEQVLGLKVEAEDLRARSRRPVVLDADLDCFRVNLDGIEPTAPPGEKGQSNDALERVKLTLTNTNASERIARLLFEKTAGGFRQRIGTPITGISAILRDTDGRPTGIPVQLSKNWHNDRRGGVYASQWFHGISQLRLPALSTTELELTLAYGHWGGVPAASHAQLCLVGWGGNQLWEQTAVGSWGESICFDPDQAQANCTITDVRPLMVRSMGRNERWGWTVNVGGGDFFRLIDKEGERVPHVSMQTTYHRQGPCLTEVTYAGRMGEGLRHSTSVSLARGDDIIRGTYRIRLDVTQAIEFSRLVLLQIGADTYNSTAERKMAFGNENGLREEWDTGWGGNRYRTEAKEWAGRIPWVSLHDGVRSKDEPDGAWANRGLVLRSWNAKLAGAAAVPWIAERGLSRGGRDSSTLDLVPPPGVRRLEPGDFVEATVEHVVLPQSAVDYYGPNDALREGLKRDGNSWRMIQREADGNDRVLDVLQGRLVQRYPDIRVAAEGDQARFRLKGGIGFVPVTFTGLSGHRDYQLLIDGKAFRQDVHGNDFWQADYDPARKTWSRTYNLPAGESEIEIRLEPIL
jgi:hypothetical protein